MGFSADGASARASSNVGEVEAVKFEPACCDLVSGDGGARPEAAASGLSREITCRWMQQSYIRIAQRHGMVWP